MARLRDPMKSPEACRSEECRGAWLVRRATSPRRLERIVRVPTPAETCCEMDVCGCMRPSTDGVSVGTRHSQCSCQMESGCQTVAEMSCPKGIETLCMKEAVTRCQRNLESPLPVTRCACRTPRCPPRKAGSKSMAMIETRCRRDARMTVFETCRREDVQQSRKRPSARVWPESCEGAKVPVRKLTSRRSA